MKTTITALAAAALLCVGATAEAHDMWAGNLKWWGSQSAVEAHVSSLPNFQSCSGYYYRGPGPSVAHGYTEDYWGAVCNLDAYYFVHCDTGYTVNTCAANQLMRA